MKKEVGTPDAETEITLHPIGRSHVGVVEYFLQGAPYRELMLEQIFSWKTAAQGGDQHWIRGKMWRQSSVREELLWLQNTVLLRVGGQRNLEWRSEVDPGEKVGGKVLFYFILFFSLSKYILIGNQIFFFHIKSVCLWWQLSSDLPVFISSLSFFILFCPKNL